MSKTGIFRFLLFLGAALVLGGLALDALPLNSVFIVGHWFAKPLELASRASHWTVLLGVLLAALGLAGLGASILMGNDRSPAGGSEVSVWLRLAILSAGVVAVLTMVLAGLLKQRGYDVAGMDFLIHGRAPECCMGKLTRIADGELGIVMERGDAAVELTHYDIDASPSSAQIKAATDLIEKTRAGVARFEDYNYTKTQGGYTISNLDILDRRTAKFEHLFNPEYMTDGKILDPERPESLIYYQATPGAPKKLVGVMYMMPPGQPGPQIGGPLTRWHYHPHTEFCSDKDGVPRVKAAPDLKCPSGLTTVTPQMMHVWLVDNPYGVFSHMMGVKSEGGEPARGHHHHSD